MYSRRIKIVKGLGIAIKDLFSIAVFVTIFLVAGKQYLSALPIDSLALVSIYMFVVDYSSSPVFVVFLHKIPVAPT